MGRHLLLVPIFFFNFWLLLKMKNSNLILLDKYLKVEMLANVSEAHLALYETASLFSDVKTVPFCIFISRRRLPVVSCPLP